MMSTTGASLTCFKFFVSTLSSNYTEVSQSKGNKDRFFKADFQDKNKLQKKSELYHNIS